MLPLILKWLTPKRKNPELIRQIALFARRFQNKAAFEETATSLMALNSVSQINQNLTPKLGHCYVMAYSNGTLVGFIEFVVRFPLKRDPYIHTFFTAVDPLYREQKIGLRLTQAVIGFAREKGISTIHRDLTSRASGAWHEKWSQKPPRMIYTKDGPIPAERVVFDSKGSDSSALIHVTPRPRRVTRKT